MAPGRDTQMLAAADANCSGCGWPSSTAIM
jgi:hypothetical protein